MHYPELFADNLVGLGVEQNWEFASGLVCYYNCHTHSELVAGTVGWSDEMETESLCFGMAFARKSGEPLWVFRSSKSSIRSQRLPALNCKFLPVCYTQQVWLELLDSQSEPGSQ